MSVIRALDKLLVGFLSYFRKPCFAETLNFGHYGWLCSSAFSYW